MCGLRAMDFEHEWPYGTCEELAQVADMMGASASDSPEKINRDFTRLFVGPQHLEAPPWGSVYLDSEAVVFGDSCAALKKWMDRGGIAIHEGGSREPVDQIGRIFVLLGWLCENEPSLVGEFLELYVLTWAPRYFEKLGKAAVGTFYEGLAKLGSLTLSGIAESVRAAS